MKNDKKMFVLIELILALLVLLIAIIMIRERTNKDTKKVSVILQNSEAHQWAGLKYGLKMAAEDQGVEMSVAGVESDASVGKLKELIEQEIFRGADAIIIQPLPGEESRRMLVAMSQKIPVMLIDSDITGEYRLPVTSANHYRIGEAIGEALLKDYDGKLEGKAIGILTEYEEQPGLLERRQGLMDVIEQSGVNVKWELAETYTQSNNSRLGTKAKVDIVIALDDNSLVTAGGLAASRDLHGALVYGVGHSMEAFYYLDTGAVQCLVVPDQFSIGYQSLTAIVKEREARSPLSNNYAGYTTIYREDLFTEENQEILYTMSQ